MRTKTTIPIIIALAIAVLVALAFSGAATAHEYGRHDRDRGVRGSRDVETRDFDLDDFDAIELDGAFDLEIEVGGEQSVSVTLDDNLFEILDMYVSGGTLVLDFDENCRPSESRVAITLPELRELQVDGAGDTEIRGFDGGDFEFRLHGAGDLAAEGRLDLFQVGLSGVGEVRARKLEAREAEVRVSGVGDVEVYATDRFEGRVSGVGDIDCYGDPDKRRARVTGIGDIDID